MGVCTACQQEPPADDVEPTSDNRLRRHTAHGGAAGGDISTYPAAVRGGSQLARRAAPCDVRGCWTGSSVGERRAPAGGSGMPAQRAREVTEGQPTREHGWGLVYRRPLGARQLPCAGYRAWRQLDDCGGAMRSIDIHAHLMPHGMLPLPWRYLAQGERCTERPGAVGLRRGRAPTGPHAAIRLEY